MSDGMQAGMEEATRLTREGRLAEATAVIQRTLGGRCAPAAPDYRSGTAEPVENTTPHTTNVPPQPTAPSRPGPNRDALRRVPRPPRGYRGMPRMPAGLSGAVSGATADIPTPAIVSAGGQFVERSYTNRAGTRAYKLYIPSGYVGQEVPLIVMLHGCTQNPDDFAAGTRINALAEEHTFLVTYPAQAAANNSSKCWNWFKVDDQQRGDGEPSLIAGITCEIVGEYHVATGQIYVAGMSAGGAMAAIMGEAYPDLYAAIGVHSGLAPGVARDLPSAFAAMRQGEAATTHRNTSTRTVPVIAFHGDRDTTVHPRNAEWLISHYRDTTGGPAPQVQQEQVSGKYAYARAIYHDPHGRAIAERWTVHGLGHAWSGGSRPGSYTDPRGPDASAEMVRFFHEHQRREQERPG
jgi:poly(hydroxyalkanoate) depolymerase family esterase